MSDTTEKNPKPGEGCCNCDYTLAFLLLRAWLGVRALLAGVEKFGAYKSVQIPVLDEHGQPDAGGAVMDMKVKYYSLANYHGIPAALKG
ncbi:MAG TPA: hypothetical protein VGI63_04585, partial [Verrucomicrobiae bacterium]